MGIYPSYGKTTVWYTLVMAKSQLDTYKLWQNHNMQIPLELNEVKRFPFMSFYDPKIGETQRISSMVQTLLGEACDGTCTHPQMRKSVKTYDK